MKTVDVCRKWAEYCVENIYKDIHTDKIPYFKANNVTGVDEYFKSYRTIVCKFFHGVFVVSTRRWSITTTKHLTQLTSAISLQTHRNEDMLLLFVYDVNDVNFISRYEFEELTRNVRYLYNRSEKRFDTIQIDRYE